MQNKEQTYLNYAGRLIYNYKCYYSTNSEYRKQNNSNNVVLVKTTGAKPVHTFNESYSVFRVNDSDLHGTVGRCFSYTGLNIKDCIIAKRYVDQSILYEIGILGDSICHSTYANSFTISRVTSNVENHCFSNRQSHLAIVGSLSSYAAMDFTCFDLINNQNLQSFLTGKDNSGWINNDISLCLSQLMSIFLCETSRNPSAFLTVPMCLELAEKINSLSPVQRSVALKQIHDASENYKDLLEKKTQAMRHGKSDEVKKIDKEIKSKFIDDNVDMSTVLKSEIVKDVVLSLFPLAMLKAVSASREISIQINAKLQQEEKLDGLQHLYDNKDGSANDLKKFLKLENALIKQYKEHVLSQLDQDVDYKKIVKNWFDCDIEYQDDVCNVIGNTFDSLYITLDLSDLT